MKLVALLLFVLFAFCHSRVVRIGMSYSSTVGGRLPPVSKENILIMNRMLKDGADIFQKYMDENGPYEIGGEQIHLQVEFREDDYSPANISKNYEDMVDSGIDFFVSGLGIIPSEAAANITEAAGKLIVSSSTTTASFSTTRKMSFSVYPLTNVQMISSFPYFRLAGVKSVTFVQTYIENNDGGGWASSTAESCIGFDTELKKAYISTFDYVYYDFNKTSETAESNYTIVANQIKDQNMDLVIFCGTDGDILNSILQNLKNIDHTPKAGLTTTIVHSYDETLSEFWVIGSSLTESEFGFPNGTFVKSTHEYSKRLNDLYFPTGFDFETLANRYRIGYFSLFAFESILNSMITANSTEVRSVSDALRKYNYTSFLGVIDFNAQNVMMHPGVLSQNIANATTTVIAPLSISNHVLVYPMPEWKKRSIRSGFEKIEISVIVVVSILLVNSVAWFIYVIISRKKKEIAASSPIFLGSMLTGSILIYLSLIFWMPNHVTKAGCSLNVAFLSIGFVLLFGSMVVKSWRVHLLFTQKTLQVFKISNSQVALFLGLLLTIEVILYIIWISLTRPSVIYNKINMYEIYNNYYSCSTSTGGTVIVWIMVGYNGLLFLYGAYLALRIRTIPFKVYDESKIIAFCIYNVGLTAIIVAILEGTSAAERYTLFGLRSFLIMISTALTINTMFIGKTTAPFFMSSSHSSYQTNQSGSSKMESVKGEEAGSAEIEVANLKKEIKMLKKEVIELTDALAVFQDPDHS